MKEIEAVLRYKTIFGSVNAPQDVFRFKISGWRNKAATMAQINIKAICMNNNPDNMEKAGLQELDSLVASGCALPVKITDIKGGPKKSENLVFGNSKKGDPEYPEYAVSVVNSISKTPEDHFVDSKKGKLPSPIIVAVIEKDIFPANKTNDSDGVDSVFNPTKITTEMLRYHKKAKILASKANT